MRANALVAAGVVLLSAAPGCGRRALKAQVMDARAPDSTIGVGGTAGNGGSGGSTGDAGPDASIDAMDAKDSALEGVGGDDATPTLWDGGDAVGTGEAAGLDGGARACNGGFSLRDWLPVMSAEASVAMLATGDLNSDGRPDVVTTNLASNSVTVRLANGDATFAPGITYATGSGPEQLALADVNRDGQLDIVSGNEGRDNVPYSVSVLLGKGDGTFAAKVDSPVTSPGWGLGLGDLDGDGTPDLVTLVAVPTWGVNVQLGAGDGTFGPAATYEVASRLVGAFALGDWNGDQRLDVIVLDGQYVFVLFGQGDGTLAVQPLPTLMPAMTSVNRLVVGDFNNDGDLDIATTSSSSPAQVSVLIGHGTKDFEGPLKSPNAHGGDVLLTSDVNGDGKLDLVTRSRVLLGNGDCTFVEGEGFQSMGTAQAIADVNRDGRPDLVTSGGDLMAVLLQAADGSFAPSLVPHPTYPTGAGATSVVLDDLNDDGKLDVVTGNTASVSVLLGKGDGSFAGQAEYPVAGKRVSLLLGDVNGDGTPDIVTGSTPVGSISVLLGRGDGTFAPAMDDDTGIGGSPLALGDVNGDGTLDVVAVGGTLLGKGDGTFAAKKVAGVGTIRAWVALGDLDGDGKLDMVLADPEDVYAGGWVGVRLGNGDGTFGAVRRIDSGSSMPDWVALVDLNGDGKLDIIARGPSPSVFLGNGDGTFSADADAGRLAGDVIALGDLDRDGKLDLVTGSAGGRLTLGSGRGDGTFMYVIDYDIGTAGLALGDLDGDGLLDIVATKPGANAVLTLLGACP